VKLSSHSFWCGGSRIGDRDGGEGEGGFRRVERVERWTWGTGREKGGGGAVVSTIRSRAILDDRQVFTVIPLVLIAGISAGKCPAGSAGPHKPLPFPLCRPFSTFSLPGLTLVCRPHACHVSLACAFKHAKGSDTAGLSTCRESVHYVDLGSHPPNKWSLRVFK
jgi:hypothetical protein